MKATEGRIGRVFILRLEDGDMMPDCVERFCAEKKVSVGHAIFVGGVDSGEVVVGPRKSDEMPPEPMLLPVDGAHEISGIGTIAPGEDGKPVLHMHASLGRSGGTMTGCIRPSVRTWLIGEVIIYEILGTNARRSKDKASGFTLLDVQ